MWSRSLAALLALALAGCGDLPQPHWGNPGGAAPWLARPLAIRLAVPPPELALLPEAEARRYAEALSEALLAAEVPATATTTPLPLDWRLVVAAEREGGSVRPTYRVLDADGRPQGAVAGAPVPLAAWAEGQREVLDAAATDGARRVTQLILGIQAARAATSPAGLAAQPRRLRLVPVRGAPGDGNRALAARLGEFLAAEGYVVQDIADGAEFAVTAEVQVVPVQPRVQRVEIQWIVSRRDGHELGRVVQLNEVPAGSLDRFWGDVAYAAAQEASGGVQQVIRNAGGS